MELEVWNSKLRISYSGFSTLSWLFHACLGAIFFAVALILFWVKPELAIPIMMFGFVFVGSLMVLETAIDRTFLVFTNNGIYQSRTFLGPILLPIVKDWHHLREVRFCSGDLPFHCPDNILLVFDNGSKKRFWIDGFQRKPVYHHSSTKRQK